MAARSSGWKVQPSVEVFVVDEMMGSGEALKETLRRDEQLRKCREMCVLAADCLLGASLLRGLIDSHRCAGVDCSILLHGHIPGTKLKDLDDTELVLISGGRLVDKVSKLELDNATLVTGEASLPAKKALLCRTRMLECRANLIDAHAYLFDGPALHTTFAASELAHATSLKADVVPYLSNRYFEAMQHESLFSRYPHAKYTHMMRDEQVAITEDNCMEGAWIPKHSLVTSPDGITPRGVAAFFLELGDDGADDDFGEPLSSRFAVRVRTIPFYTTTCRHVLGRATKLGLSPQYAGKLRRHEGSLLGDCVTLGKKVQLRHSTIGADSVLREGCKVNNSVLMEKVTLGHSCIVHNSVICAGAFLHDNCTIDDCQVAAGAIVPPNTQAKQEIFLPENA
jgi:hypothetical protein